MDTEPVEFEDFRACLVDLARVERWMLAYHLTRAFFDRVFAGQEIPEGHRRRMGASGWCCSPSQVQHDQSGTSSAVID